MNQPVFKWTEDNTVSFLRVLESTGKYSHASRAIGAPLSAYRLRSERDPLFKAKMEEAIQFYKDGFEVEAVRRAVNGVDKDIYWQGTVVGTEKHYSDSLLARLLRANDPDKFGDKQEVNHNVNGTIQHDLNLDALSHDEQIALFDMLSRAATVPSNPDGKSLHKGQTPLEPHVEDAEYTEVSE